jgi:acetate kinase
MMNKHIIVFNAGSSSLKFSIFDAHDLSVCFYGIVDNILINPNLFVHDKNKKEVFNRKIFKPGYQESITALFDWIKTYHKGLQIIAAGHRIVHGGRNLLDPTIIDNPIIDELKSLIHLAPLHQPYNIAAIEILAKFYPQIIQVACFDTAFHNTQPKIAKLFALPLTYAEEGIIRYGFHGLSYEYIASVLPQYIFNTINSKIIVAHLGNGASMCAMHNLKSIATTMGFTALDGLVMGTRCGNIDPGVVLYLLEERHLSIQEVTNLLYKESGLRGVSEIGHDIRDLLASNTPEADIAIKLFCYQAAKQLAGLIPTLGGLDALVFTAGIGENSPVIRKNICDLLLWLGVEIATDENIANQPKISKNTSLIDVYVIPTDEEKIIAEHTYNLCIEHFY